MSLSTTNLKYKKGKNMKKIWTILIIGLCSSFLCSCANGIYTKIYPRSYVVPVRIKVGPSYPYYYSYYPYWNLNYWPPTIYRRSFYPLIWNPVYTREIRSIEEKKRTFSRSKSNRSSIFRSEPSKSSSLRGISIKRRIIKRKNNSKSRRLSSQL